MEQRATIFVEAMIVFVIIGVLAFLIGLIVRVPHRQRAATSGAGGSQPDSSPRWYEFTLALILLAAIAAFAIWIISSGSHWVWGEAIEDWRPDGRATTFAAIMIAFAVIGLVVSLIYALVQSSQQEAPARKGGAAATTGAGAETTAAPATELSTAEIAALVESYLPLVASQTDRVWLSSRIGLTRDDLISAGCYGLLLAARRFDPSRGVGFGVFARAHVHGALMREINAAMKASGASAPFRHVGRLVPVQHVPRRIQVTDLV